MSGETILPVWSIAALIWWVVAWRLVATANKEKVAELKTASRQSLSIFKPLPPLSDQGLKIVATGLESFIGQLDEDSELLIGVHEADRDLTGPFLKRLRTDHPQARVKIIFRSEADDVANPKIAWQKVLARHATGDLWLWSDADIVAPRGFLQAARHEYARAGVKMITFPYVVREISPLPTLLEALFVNVEFYPGVLLLRNMGTVDFGLGAGMLFSRDDFTQQVEWDEIGAWLGDDFFLGQKLRPVAIGQATLSTLSAARSWLEAASHDFRWAKTIRWNRPVGFFSRIVTMPVLGWLTAVAFHPTQLFAWMGFLGMIQAEVGFAWLISRTAGCTLDLKRILLMEIWSIWRVLLWFFSWLPCSVRWNDKLWRQRAKLFCEFDLSILEHKPLTTQREKPMF